MLTALFMHANDTDVCQHAKVCEEKVSGFILIELERARFAVQLFVIVLFPFKYTYTKSKKIWGSIFNETLPKLLVTLSLFESLFTQFP